MNKIRINFSKISFISLLCAAVLLLLGNLRVWAHIPLPMITFGKIQKPAYFPMKMVWVFPEPGMFDSASNKIQKIYSGEITATIGKSRFFGWDLKKNTELIPGLWKMQLWYKEKIICEKCFIVVLPSENKPKAPIY